MRALFMQGIVSQQRTPWEHICARLGVADRPYRHPDPVALAALLHRPAAQHAATCLRCTILPCIFSRLEVPGKVQHQGDGMHVALTRECRRLLGRPALPFCPSQDSRCPLIGTRHPCLDPQTPARHHTHACLHRAVRASASDSRC